jgi:hypothetical protein
MDTIVHRYQPCAWCDEINDIVDGKTFCANCGHRADVAIMRCDCLVCTERQREEDDAFIGELNGK